MPESKLFVIKTWCCYTVSTSTYSVFPASAAERKISPALSLADARFLRLTLVVTPARTFALATIFTFAGAVRLAGIAMRAGSGNLDSVISGISA